jgi:predicted amidohydrolase YtcJ
MRNFLKLIAVTSILFSCGEKKQPVEQIIVGKIWTANQQQPWAEAIAINSDTIVAVGSKSEILSWKGDRTKVSEVSGLVVPGFIDTHTHFGEGGFTLSSVQLRNAKTKQEFIDRIKEFATTIPPGTWIMGGNWDHENWGGELPTREWIDAVTPNNPVWINRLDGHMALANTTALKAAKVTSNTPPVVGGTIVRDKKGNVTGVLKDNAMSLVDNVVPAMSAETEDRALQAAMNYVAAQGVTTAHSVSGYIDAFERAHSSGKLITRIYAGVPLSHWRDLDAKIKTQGRGDRWLKFGCLKAFMDGSLGSHTAAFLKPFYDAPKDSGLIITPEEKIYQWTKSADSSNLHVMIHAIGDKAINHLLNVFERVEKENGAKDRRFRIEHAQHIAASDISRFAQLGIIASMQPYHAIDDGRWAEKIIGKERCKTTYAFKSLLDAKAKVVFGSDWPVAPPTPLEGIYAAVTRRTLDEKNPDGWVPEQKISVAQALTAYTNDAAYASFDEKIKGSLERGKLADLVVLDQNIFEIAPEKIRDVKVLKTIVGGKEVYSQSPKP